MEFYLFARIREPGGSDLCAFAPARNSTVKLQSLNILSSSVDGLHGDGIEQSTTSNSFCLDRSHLQKEPADQSNVR